VTAYPTIGSGQRVTALLLQDMQQQAAVATTTQSVTSSTANQNDAELTLPVEASASYLVEFVVAFNSAADCDVRTSWGVPTGSTGLRQVTSATDTAADFTSRTNTNAQLRSIAFATSSAIYQLHTTGTSQAIWEYGIVSTGDVAGSVTFRWAQGTSTATALVRAIGSFLRITRYA
jgi:hypothetical protein